MSFRDHAKTSLFVAAALFAALALAPGAGAATFDQRDILIKGPGSGSAVYFLATNSQRYVFPDEKTFLSWFTGFGDVKTVTLADLMAFPLGGNVTYRPGIRMVKITTDPKVYAVERGGVLRWVTTESLARQLYGSDWNTKIVDVPDPLFVNYTLGSPITSAGDYDPEAAANLSQSIAMDKGLNPGLIPLLSDTRANVGDAKTRRTVTGTCTGKDRDITSFACPVTPTRDICGVPPFVTCFLGASEACPAGMVWDPACSCTCIPR